MLAILFWPWSAITSIERRKKKYSLEKWQRIKYYQMKMFFVLLTLISWLVRTDAIIIKNQNLIAVNPYIVIIGIGSMSLAAATTATITSTIAALSTVPGINGNGYASSTNRAMKNGLKFNEGNGLGKESIESSLKTIHDIATENLGTLCMSQAFRPLKIPLNAERYEGARQKADLAAIVLQDVGVNRHGGLLDALAKGLLSDPHVTSARILATNVSTGILGTSVWWTKQNGGLGGPNRVEEDGVQIGTKPDTNYPWFEDEISSPGLRSPKFAPSPPNISYRGWWTFPYYSCTQRRWILSYSVAIAPIGRHGMRGFLSIDIDVSELQVNQCDPPITIDYTNLRYNKLSTSFLSSASVTSSAPSSSSLSSLPSSPFISATRDVMDTVGSTQTFVSTRALLSAFVHRDDQLIQIEAFHESHKCHRDNMQCEYRPHINNVVSKPAVNMNGWARGAYQCLCKPGFYSLRHPHGFNGTIMEVAYQEYMENVSTFYMDSFHCLPCAPGCTRCLGPAPCLASYNWPFRVSLLIISVLCAIFTIVLAAYMYHNRKVKVFKVASPIFLTITLLGCAIMYLEMAAIFPILDTYSCIATKWTRHMGFCITYTALLMKTWRVSLTYRVKSAHKVKLTDKQLLQWMVPILLVMLIYLGTWTLSAPPTAEVITDQYGLKFKQCSYNWWDHSLAIGEVLFLAWGIRVCYNVRNAESMYNEAKLISYAIYNIALVNTAMVMIHLFLFPQAGPDIKYLLGFVRTQLSTSVTIALVFGPKVVRVIRGQGDQWDNRARVRGITASFSLNGIGLVPEDSPDLYQENEELKEEIQKLAAQIEFMKIVNMEMNNRHIKPKPGGYFTVISSSLIQSPMNRGTLQTNSSKLMQHPNSNNNSGISDDGHSGTNSIGNNSIGYCAVAPAPITTSVVIVGVSGQQQQQQQQQQQHLNGAPTSTTTTAAIVSTTNTERV